MKRLNTKAVVARFDVEIAESPKGHAAAGIEAVQHALAIDEARSDSKRREEERSRAALLDKVLDKISTRGLDSLTTEERALLDETSRKLRGDDNPSGR